MMTMPSIGSHPSSSSRVTARAVSLLGVPALRPLLAGFGVPFSNFGTIRYLSAILAPCVKSAHPYKIIATGLLAALREKCAG